MTAQIIHLPQSAPVDVIQTKRPGRLPRDIQSLRRYRDERTRLERDRQEQANMGPSSFEEAKDRVIRIGLDLPSLEFFDLFEHLDHPDRLRLLAYLTYRSRLADIDRRE